MGGILAEAMIWHLCNVQRQQQVDKQLLDAWQPYGTLMNCQQLIEQRSNRSSRQVDIQVGQPTAVSVVPTTRPPLCCRGAHYTVVSGYF